MASKRAAKTKKTASHPLSHGEHGELVIVTGMSGSGKLSALKAFEDLGYYSVDNLPLELYSAVCGFGAGSRPRLIARRWWWMYAKGCGWTGFRRSWKKRRRCCRRG